MAINEELAKQVEVQCASLDAFHLLQERWRKDRIKLEEEIRRLTNENIKLEKINVALGNLYDKFNKLVKEGNNGKSSF